MTVLFRDPPTRGPVMDFCESEARGGEKKKKKKSRSLSAVSVGLTCILQWSLAPTAAAVQTGLWNAPRHGRPLVQSEESARWSVLWDWNAPRPIRGVFLRSCTHSGTWLVYAVHVRATGEDKHCCCVKCRRRQRRGGALALLTRFYSTVTRLQHGFKHTTSCLNIFLHMLLCSDTEIKIMLLHDRDT